MQISDILRKVADIVDQVEGEGVAQEPGVQQAPGAQPDQAQTGQLTAVDVSSDDNTETDSMISPLQQEHELLKKSQGVENNVSEFAGDEGLEGDVEEGRDDMPDGGELAYDQAAPKEITPDDDTSDHDRQDQLKFAKAPKDSDAVDEGNDELAQIKKNAGIGEEAQAPINHAADCQPASQNPKANAALQYNSKPHLKHTKRRTR